MELYRRWVKRKVHCSPSSFTGSETMCIVEYHADFHDVSCFFPFVPSFLPSRFVFLASRFLPSSALDLFQQFMLVPHVYAHAEMTMRARENFIFFFVFLVVQRNGNVEYFRRPAKNDSSENKNFEPYGVRRPFYFFLWILIIFILFFILFEGSWSLTTSSVL